MDTLASTAAPPVSRRTAAIVTLALAVGSFGIGTGEFAIMGLLPQAAEGLHVSTPEAGHLISAYALGVVVGAPVIAVLAAKLPRRALLLLLMLAFAGANGLSALAPGYLSMIVARFLAGLPHGAYFGVAALVAASMVAPNRRAQAVGRVMLGLTVATLVGTPITASLGQWFGWRAMFVLVGAIGAVTVGLLALTLPRDRVKEGASALTELGAFAQRQVWLTLAMAAVGFGGMFAVFSYIASTATEVAGLSADWVPLILAVFGAGMVGGNVAGSWLADRSLMGTLAGMMSFNVADLALFALTAQHPVMLALCVFAVGFGVAIGPAVQTRLMDVAGDAQTLAAASMHSAFNIANALGAWLGGLAIAAGYGYASTGWVGALLGLGGLLIFVVSWREEQAAVARRREAAAAPCCA
ncbi:MFS transporter [Aureimonas leprariae]|uniref:MFS transporter n=2 Tax=Plantimonas leprariae TaxID=2615207 RepID=A0A7V7PTJ7_9HYPH|nr:MFS transporter [Aureimonas leprariae]KAB0682993.1 MFS transporter [Aureimonas leprariae]